MDAAAIPEVAWNDTASGVLSAGGGGRSIYFSKPGWQTGNGVPNDNARDVLRQAAEMQHALVQT